jgi:hypothetical protein
MVSGNWRFGKNGTNRAQRNKKSHHWQPFAPWCSAGLAAIITGQQSGEIVELKG